MSAKDIAEITNLWVQSTAILLAGGWAFFVFVYKEYLSHEARSLMVDLLVEAKVIQENTDHFLVQADLKIKNPSKSKIKLVQTPFFVLTGSFGKKEYTDEEFRINLAKAQNNEGFSRTMRHAGWKDSKMCAGGHIIQSGYCLDPGETLPATICVWIPRGPDFIHLRAEAIISNMDYEVDSRWIPGEIDAPVMEVRAIGSEKWLGKNDQEKILKLLKKNRAVTAKAYVDLPFPKN